jgi:hypothetical protein
MWMIVEDMAAVALVEADADMVAVVIVWADVAAAAYV